MGDKNNSKVIKLLKEYIPYIIIIILVIMIKKYIFAPVRVSGDSMNKTLLNGDIMILNVIDYKINDLKRFDIVVIDEGSEYIIKRVIGLPNDTVEIKNNKLFINNKLVKDNHSIGKTEDLKVKVPKNRYFVLGDNRENSLDSRYFGFFKKNQIKGKTSLILFPFNRLGNVK